MFSMIDKSCTKITQHFEKQLESTDMNKLHVEKFRILATKV